MSAERLPDNFFAVATHAGVETPRFIEPALHLLFDRMKRLQYTDFSVRDLLDFIPDEQKVLSRYIRFADQNRSPEDVDWIREHDFANFDFAGELTGGNPIWQRQLGRWERLMLLREHQRFHGFARQKILQTLMANQKDWITGVDVHNTPMFMHRFDPAESYRRGKINEEGGMEGRIIISDRDGLTSRPAVIDAWIQALSYYFRFEIDEVLKNEVYRGAETIELHGNPLNYDLRVDTSRINLVQLEYPRNLLVNEEGDYSINRRKLIHFQNLFGRAADGVAAGFRIAQADHDFR